MHLLLWAEDSENELRGELALAFPQTPIRLAHPGVLELDFSLAECTPPPHLAFERQILTNARLVHAESVRSWANLLGEEILGTLPDGQPWSLHIEPHYGSQTSHRIGARAWHSRLRKSGTPSRGPEAGQETGKEKRNTPEAGAGKHRCGLICEAVIELLRKKRRHLLRRLRVEPAPFTLDDSLVQLLLTSPVAGFLSVARAPLPFTHRHWLSPFPKGELAVAQDQTAPSRAFAKLVEAEQRLGHAIRVGETCVDLGASPGSWTYHARNRGARVVAVDRSDLREDLMRDPEVEFRKADAFGFRPASAVDWLLCDVLAAPEETAELLLAWLRCGWCRQFVVTLKLKDASGAKALTKLKRELPPLTHELFLTRLCANKKEVCAFGTRNLDSSQEIEHK